MRLTLDIRPDLAALMAAEIAAGERAVTAAVREAGTGLKLGWRGQITGAGLGARLANSIRSEVFPKAGASLNAAAVVWSKAPVIIGAHDAGPLIRARNGLWLAIPTPAAGKALGGRRITPAAWERRTGLRLRFVYRRTGPSLLVAPAGSSAHRCDGGADLPAGAAGQAAEAARSGAGRRAGARGGAGADRGELGGDDDGRPPVASVATRRQAACQLSAYSAAKVRWLKTSTLEPGAPTGPSSSAWSSGSSSSLKRASSERARSSSISTRSSQPLSSRQVAEAARTRCGHLVRFLLALPQKLPRALHAFGRVDLAELPAFVAHLRSHLEELRLQRAEIRMAPKMLEALAHAVELALQAEAAVSVGGMRRLVGLRDVPHRDPEASMRVLQTHHPIVHRDKEAEAEKEQRQGELDGRPGVGRDTAQADIEPEPGGEADCSGEAPDRHRQRQGTGWTRASRAAR